MSGVPVDGRDTGTARLKVVAPDVALDEFHRFCAAMDLDVDESAMDEETLKGFQSTRRRVLLAIEQGHLSINDNGEPVFVPQEGNRAAITFHEPTGATILALDKAKKGQDVHKAFYALADLSRESVARFSSMQGRDFKVCQAVLTLFLA